MPTGAPSFRGPMRPGSALVGSRRQLRPVASLLIGTLVLWAGRGNSLPHAYAEDSREMPKHATSALEGMSPEQKVGQLFLVAFYAAPGLEDPLEDAISLIEEQKVGGIVLQRSSQAFVNRAGEALPSEIAEITARLQEHALGESGSGVPLFIAVDHEGDGDPLSHLREGFTALPSQLAIGATWDPSAAETIGRIAGEELAAVGVNLLLGPVMDVLADPRVDTGGDIGIRAFGGHPHWVAQMGLAYIRGVHQGGRGRVATVAKHFPGHGGSDRNPDQRAGTVYKSLNELKRIELPPFAAVASRDPERASDALMTSHIRYSGFQGPNIMDVTPPVSFDQAVMQQILSLEGFEFSAWHQAGGIIVSDALGVNAVKYYFDPSGETFNPREVARRAFLAGNDLLILSQFGIGAEGAVAWSEQLANIRSTQAYFAGQYRRDARFRARVDEALHRILARKAAMYEGWSEAEVRADPAAAAGVGKAESRDAIAQIARRSVVVLRSLRRPGPGDRLVFVTQDPISAADPKRRPLACPYETCGLDLNRWRQLTGLGPTLVESFSLDGFGPGGSGTIDPAALRSLTFCQLEAALSPPAEPTVPPDSAPGEAPTPESLDSEAPGSGPTRSRLGCLPIEERATVLEDLSRADWIIFAFADLGGREQISVLNGFFLRQLDRLDLIHAHLGVLSFGAPYYLDATNFTRLDFFAAAFSKIPASIEAAVAALFDPFWAPSERANLPVTYEDSGYVLDQQLAPDPARPLALETSIEGRDLGPPPQKLGLSVGPVIDRNGNAVPDGTVITIEASPMGALAGAPIAALTSGGIAAAEISLVESGEISLGARAGDASSPVLTVRLEEAPAMPEAGEASATSRTAEATSGRPAGAVTEGAEAMATDRPGPSDLFLALAAILLGSVAASAAPGRGRSSPDLQLRAALLSAAGGLAAYLVWGWLLRSGIIPPGWSASAGGAALLASAGGLFGWGLSRLLRPNPGSSPGPRARAS